MLRKLIACLLISMFAIPASAFATNYYVNDTGGDNSRNCMTAQTIGTPKKTITSALSCLSAGDTLYVRSGTYVESFTDTVPPGSSWGSPVTISAYMGETVTLRPSFGSHIFNFGIAHQTATQYIILYGLTLDGTNLDNLCCTNPVGDSIKVDCNPACAHHLRFDHMTYKNSPGNGLFVQGGFVEQLNSEFFNNATDGDPGPGIEPLHDIYWSAADGLIEGNYIHDSGAAGPDPNHTMGIQLYSGSGGVSRNVFRNNLVKNHPYGNNIVCCSGTGNKIYNNVSWGTGSNIAIGYGSVDAELYNNTVTESPSDHAICVHNTGPGGNNGNTTLRNNILYLNTHNDIGACAGGTAETGLSGRTSNTLTADPHWSGPGNFHITVDDNGGVAVGIVTIDADGVTRANPPDRGAYEYIPPGSPAAKPVYYSGLISRNR